MKLDIFGGQVFHSLEKCLLHYDRILIAKTNPNPSSLELALWEYQFILVRFHNGFIAACNVFVCINVVWSDKYLGLVLLSEVSLGNWIFLHDSVRTAIFFRTRILVPSREERTLMWTLVILALGVLPGSTSALPPWGWSLPNDVTGSCHKGNGDQGVTCRIYCGSIFLQGDALRGCPLASLPEMVWWGPRTGQIPDGFPITAARAQLGVGSKELGNQSSVTVIFMGTLTNLCAWDQTTISKNISKYSFALFCFGKNYSCSCCHLTWKQHMEQLQQLHFVTFSNVSAVTGQMDQWLKWKQRRSKWVTKLFQTLPDICF